MKAAKNKKVDPLKSKSFRTQRALSRKPEPKKLTQARKSEITAFDSLKYKPIMIGNMVNSPDICSRNPKLANKRLVIAYLNTRNKVFS